MDDEVPQYRFASMVSLCSFAAFAVAKASGLSAWGCIAWAAGVAAAVLVSRAVANWLHGSEFH